MNGGRKDPAGPDECSAAGRIAEVVYAGAQTRFLVDLAAGARLVALRQNLDESSADVARHRGTEVVLAWRREHTIHLAGN